MKKTYLLLLLLLLPFCTIRAQVIEGTIKDAKTNQNLPYVNVGIVGKSIGTVTDADGNYKLNLTGNTKDTLRISMIGYYAKQFITGSFAANINANKVVMLQPEVVQLKEVKVNNRKWKTGILGNKTRSKSTNGGFTSNQLGNEIGSIIKIKHSPTRLKQFNAAISHPASDSVKLRLNFYTVKDGLPDQILQGQNIFVTVKAGQEMVTVDLEPYDIVVEDKFFVSLEWIKTSKGHGLMFSASLLSGAVISRDASQAAWEKVGIAGLGFNVLAEY